MKYSSVNSKKKSRWNIRQQTKSVPCLTKGKSRQGAGNCWHSVRSVNRDLQHCSWQPQSSRFICQDTHTHASTNCNALDCCTNIQINCILFIRTNSTRHCTLHTMPCFRYKHICTASDPLKCIKNSISLAILRYNAPSI